MNGSKCTWDLEVEKVLRKLKGSFLFLLFTSCHGGGGGTTFATHCTRYSTSSLVVFNGFCFCATYLMGEEAQAKALQRYPFSIVTPFCDSFCKRQDTGGRSRFYGPFET